MSGRLIVVTGWLALTFASVLLLLAVVHIGR